MAAGHLAILIGEALKKKHGEAAPSEEEGDGGSMALSAMREFIDHVKSGDEQAALDCFHDLIEMCSGGEESYSPQEE